jgi:hypothetical protein
MLSFSGLFALPRGEWRTVVLVVLVGVFARPAGLHGLCSGFRSLPFDSVLFVKGEFARVESGLEESDGLLRLFDARGKRDVDFAGSGGLRVLDVGEG